MLRERYELPSDQDDGRDLRTLHAFPLAGATTMAHSSPGLTDALPTLEDQSAAAADAAIEAVATSTTARERILFMASA